MDYYLVELRTSFDGYDYSVMPLFRPGSYIVVRGRLMKFLSLDVENKVRHLVIYKDSLPFERIEVLNGRIIHSYAVVDNRKKAEIDADFRYEARSRRAQSVARSVISNDWYRDGKDAPDDVVHILAQNWVKTQKKPSVIFGGRI